MKRTFIFICGLGSALAAFAQPSPQSPQQAADSMNRMWHFERVNPNNDWTRHFRAGALVGLNIKAKFSMNGNFNISGSNPNSGIYDDGYVRVDDTGNAGGYTSYWGYQNASQLSGTTLTMHSVTSFTGSGGGSGNDSPYLGLDMAYGDSYWYWGRAKLGWEIGFGLLPFHITDNQPMSVTATRSVFAFDTGGIILPNAPYNGGPSGIGPTILAARTQLADDSISGTVTGTRALDVTLYTLRLGPTLYWDLNEHIGLYASAGPAVGLVSGDLNYNETLLLSDGSSAHNTGSISGTDMTYGGYVNATLVYHVVENGDFYLGAQFMPMKDARISGAGREGKLSLGGQVYITAGIEWPF